MHLCRGRRSDHLYLPGVGGPGAKDVSHVDVPEAAVCAEVVGGDYEYVSPDPNTGVTGFKSKGGRGTLTLVLAGEVRVDGTATYAIKSGDGVFRVDGPGLVCDAADEVHDVDTERMTLRLVTFHCPAEGKSRTVFEALETDAEDGGVKVLEDGSCVRAAAVGFVVRATDGEVVIQAATDGLGGAEVALLPGTYVLEENVLEASTEVTVTEAEALSVAVVILGAVLLEVEADAVPAAKVVRVPEDEDVETEAPAEDVDIEEATEPEAVAPDVPDTETEGDDVDSEEVETDTETDGERGAEEAEVPAEDVEVDEEEPGAEDGDADAESEDRDDAIALGGVTDSTGAIVVRKYTCDFADPPPGIEWEETCPLSTESTRTFRFTQAESETAAPPSVGTTVDGLMGC